MCYWNMIIIALICWMLTVSQVTAHDCLTGHMTDVQSWVDDAGRLTIEEDSVDVSDSAKAVFSLMIELEKISRSGQGQVRYLSMARCRLRKVPEVFKAVDRDVRTLADTVEYMTFYGNQFDDQQSTGDRYDSYINATNVESLTLTNRVGYDTRVTSFWPAGFMGVHFMKLKQLDLRACAISTLSGSIFQGMDSLEALYLSDNSITFVNAKAFVGLANLAHLDLSRNFEFDEFGDRKPLLIESIDVMEELENLVSLDLSHTRLLQGNLMMFKNFGKKFERLSLCETGLSHVREKFFSQTSLRFLDISGNSEILNHFNALAGTEDTLEVLYADEISLYNFDMFEGFKRLEILKLSKNDIATVKPKTAETLSRLQILDLDWNRVNTWIEPIFSKMRNLKYLSLKHNNLNMIDADMVDDFQTVNFVGLAGNSVICNCNTRELFEKALVSELDEKLSGNIFESNLQNNQSDFRSFHTGFIDYNRVVENRKNVSQFCDLDEYCDSQIYGNTTSGTFYLLDYDPNLYQCMLVSDGKHVPYSNAFKCNQTTRHIDIGEMIMDSRRKLYALIILPGIMLPVLIFAYVFRRNFRYFCITLRNSALLSMINNDKTIDVDSRIFNYDVFVSYCNEDRGWILDHLLPHLESDCRVSVCLHERDFQVGLSILENIVSCLDRSRTIMLIISRQFLLSQWCQFEMHLAQHRLLETRREDLIIVLLEDIPRRLRPTTLHYLMLSKTYIVYPPEGEGDGERREFWKRLRRSVVARRKIEENDSLA